MLGEGRRHDDQRKAIAGTGAEGLRRVAGHAGVIAQAQLPLGVKRFDQGGARVALLRAELQMGCRIALHLVAEGKNVVCLAGRVGSGKELIVQQLAAGSCTRRRAARRERGEQQQGGQMLDGLLHRQPPAAARLPGPELHATPVPMCPHATGAKRAGRGRHRRSDRHQLSVIWSLLRNRAAVSRKAAFGDAWARCRA